MTNKLVIIKWLDAFTMDNWQTRAVAIQNTRKPMTCRTVGFVLSEKGKCVTVSHTLNEEGQVCGVMQIPKKCIVKMTKLK